MTRYKLRIPSISLLWLYRAEAQTPQEAIIKVADTINSKTVDYHDPAVWEVEEESHCPKWTMGNGRITL